jgi:hypothetical protein
MSDLQTSNPVEYQQLLQYAGGDPNALNAIYLAAAMKSNSLLNNGQPLTTSGNSLVYGVQSINPTTGAPTISTTTVSIPNLPNNYKVSSYSQAANGTVTYLAFPTDAQGNQTVNPSLPNNGIISGVIGAAQSNTTIGGVTLGIVPNGVTSNEALTGQGIINGTVPPLTGMGANSATGLGVKAYLAANGFDSTTASLDYTAMTDYMSTMNSQQQIRLKQAATAVPDMLTNVQSLYNDFYSQAPSWGITTVNSASLAAAVAGAYGSAAQAAGVQLQQQITDITSDLGTIYKGGNMATDQALQTGAEQLDGAWDSDTFTAAIQQIQTNIGYRINAINQVGVGGVGSTNPYAASVGVNTGTPVPDSSGAQPSGSTITITTQTPGGPPPGTYTVGADGNTLTPVGQ